MSANSGENGPGSPEKTGDSDLSDGTTSEIEELLDDARRVLDHQIAFAQASDEENQQILRYNLLILAAFTTLLAYGVDVGQGSSFVNLPTMMGTIFAVLSIGVAASKFVSKVYGGFGDSPSLRLHNLAKNIDEDDLNITGDETELSGIDIENMELVDDLRMRMLVDYQRGIRHNNKESIYRVVLQRRSVLLIVTAVVLYGIGGASALTTEGETILSVGNVVTIDWGMLIAWAWRGVAIVGCVIFLNALYWIWLLKHREDKDGRMEYNHYDSRTQFGWYTKIKEQLE